MSLAPTDQRPPEAIRRERLLLVLWAVLLLLLSWHRFTRFNDFPYYYHPDETGKCEQVLSGESNFNHPMLMLNTARLAVRLQYPQQAPSLQQVVETGRTVSALFAALAVVALSLTAFLWAGWLPAILAGMALMWHHQLYELAHYMKEDTALLLGVGAVCLTLTAFAQRPTILRALCLGAACGLAISGKYIGVMMLALALPVIWLERGERKPLTWALFAAGLLAVLVVVNWPLLADYFAAPKSVFQKNLAKEVDLVMHGQGEVTRNVPHALYWNIFIDNSTPVIWLLLVAYFLGWRRRVPAGGSAERLIALFPLVFALALSFSPKENDRYFLPVTAIFTMLAAVGVQNLPRLFARMGKNSTRRTAAFLSSQPVRHWGMIVAGVALLIMQLTGWWRTKPGLLRYEEAFRVDDVKEVTAWMARELPPGTKIAVGPRTGLPDSKRKKHEERLKQFPKHLSLTSVKPEKDTLAGLRGRGVQYVVISESNYGRYFRSDLRTKNKVDEKYQRAKAFYEELLRQGAPVFDRDRGTVIYLHPGLRVYRL